MEPSTDRPSRRGVLVLLGAVGVLAPASLVLQLDGSAGAEVDGLRFDVLGVTRHTLDGHAHHAGVVPLSEGTSWPDVVRVQLRVRNVAALPLLVSPGQFRLRVHGDLSVMPTAWQHGAAALAASRTRSGWIDYRAPGAQGLYRLEFAPAGRAEPVAVALAVPGGAA